jgi:hypothetical protein
MTPREYEAAREALGWTHAKLAETIGVSIRTPYRYQGGEGGIPEPRSSSLASAERPLAAGRKRSRRSTPHPVFPAGGCTTCAGRLRQGGSASACASKSPTRC